MKSHKSMFLASASTAIEKRKSYRPRQRPHTITNALNFEALECRSMLSGTSFGSEQYTLIQHDALQVPSEMISADLNGDGLKDLLGRTGATPPNRVSWFQNTSHDGVVSFSAENIIVSNATGLLGVTAADLDGDSDLDLVISSFGGDGPASVQWYENIDGRGDWGNPRALSEIHERRETYAADLDGDGDQDLVTAVVDWQKGSISWYENLDGAGNFGSPVLVRDAINVDGALEVVPADLDGDGDLDLTWSAWSTDTVAWQANFDGHGTFREPHYISTTLDGVASLFVFDVDGDDDLDVLCRGAGDMGPHNEYEISWFENVDGKGGFGAKQLIAGELKSFEIEPPVDLDVDGDLD